VGHHFVPQKYLQGFTNLSCPNRLWLFDKETLTFSERPVSIKKIAQKPSYYDDETERDLNQIVEVPGNRVLDKLRSGNIFLQKEERKALSRYIATMFKRVPSHRAEAEELVPSVLNKVFSETRDQILADAEINQLSAEITQHRISEVDNAETKYNLEIPDIIREQIEKPWPSEDIINCVYDMHWTFVCAEGDNYFLVTDNPAFFFKCYGIGTENSELTFPISRNLAIFASWTPRANGSKIISRPQLVKEANRRLISKTFRFIYSPRKDEWIHKVAEKRNPYLSKLKW
jgi:hypothetical protein